MTQRPNRDGSARRRFSFLAPSLLLLLGGCVLALVPEGTGDAETAVELGEPVEVGDSEVAEEGLESVTGTVPASVGPSVEGLRETALGRA
ncbi:MAG TPA: hypothetical protein VJJ77_04305, partial [Dongiaceae bacterium]|nr:hypothetical protein [Dongiaceae bacterium]